ncbi:hypothetical protein [Actinomadura sp. 3N407]|uniref:hypothetical protein n=1 Tax=Actinomadura sp. 3N407 TaxID=3457423 RepID=UPI003FCCB9C3
MGFNSKTTHQAYTVAPAQAEEDSSPAVKPLVGKAAEAVAEEMWVPGTGPDLYDAIHTADQAYLVGANTQDPVEDFDHFASLVTDARDYLDAAEQAGVDPAKLEKLQKSLNLISQDYLKKLSPEELQQLAGSHGFEHPALVGLSGSDAHPLAHYLDPAYDADSPSKAKIQAAANERYAKLCAGETVGGMTLADLQTIEGASPANGTVPMTPDEFNQAAERAADAAVAVSQAHVMGNADKGEKLAEFIQAHNELAAAYCTVDTEGYEAFKKGASLGFGGMISAADITATDLGPSIQAGIQNGHITADQAQVMTPGETLALLQQMTPGSERQAIASTAAQRLADLAHFQGAHAAVGSVYDPGTGKVGLPALDGPNKEHAMAAAGNFAAEAAALAAAQSNVAGWASGTPAAGDQPPTIAPGELTKGFNAWAKQQKIGDLRALAEKAGLQDADQASRAQANSYIAGAWDPDRDRTQIQEKVTGKKLQSMAVAASAPPDATTLDSAAAAGSAPAAAGANGSAPAPGAGPAKPNANANPTIGTDTLAAIATMKADTGFAAKHNDLLAALRNVQATASDVPQRLDPAAVASWDFGPGKAASLGGQHTKSVHVGPDGGDWMFKPDKHNGGARGHAEAAASDVFHAGGMAAVPVYSAKIGHHKGAVQPLVKGAKTLSSSPKSWSQAEVDEMVRFHVASWLVGNHDGHAGNVLSTQSKGVLQIDNGAAFKHYGADKLSLDFDPHGCGPVYQQAYKAHQSGKLAPGVKVNPAVAHPVIKAYEQMPDSQWRAMLHTTAHEGARNNVAWVQRMRDRAATRHGISASKVSDQQVAEEFLQHACERKASLRKDFAAFFTNQLNLPTGALLRHGG